MMSGPLPNRSNPPARDQNQGDSPMTEPAAALPMRWWALRADPRGMVPQRRETTLASTGLPRHPFPVERALARHGYQAYVPTESWSRKRSRWTRARCITTRALIPGFLMCRIAGPVNWFHLLSTPYVLGTYGMLREIDGSDARALAQIEAELEADPRDPFQVRPGQTATLTHGPLAGQTLELTDVLYDLPDPVAKGLVEAFGGKVEVEVPLQDLRGEG